MTERLQIATEPSEKTRKPLLSRRVAKLAATVTAAAVGFLGAGEAIAPEKAEAAAYAKSVSPPKADGNTVIGRARVNLDERCEGTLGCWSYIKVEYKPDNPATPSWLNSEWHYVDGQWAKDGKNEVEADVKPGCGYYRTVVDSYNDMYGEQGSIGIGAGVRGVEASVEKTMNGVSRHHTAVASSAARICMTA